jgi:E3 ubiquitin-protein ligase SHPRH
MPSFFLFEHFDRDQVITLLSQKLSSNTSDAEADGEEYSRGLKVQEEAEAYLQSLVALLADRKEALTAERTLLTQHDDRVQRNRQTKCEFWYNPFH